MSTSIHGGLRRGWQGWTTILFLAAALVGAGGAATALAAEQDAALEAIRGSLRAREYDKAVELAEKYQGEQPDEALHLKATAHFNAGRFDAAVAAADQVVTKHPKSPWFHKAVFLKGEALTRQRKFAEAEKVFAEQANQLLAAGRKKEIAGVIVRFADALVKEPDENDPGAPKPNYGKAYQLYTKALTMEIDDALRDELMYKKAYTIQKAENHGQAINDFRAYLQEFDPQWLAEQGQLPKQLHRGRIGAHRFDARYRLGKSQLAANQPHEARRTWEDLLSILKDPAARAGFARPVIQGDDKAARLMKEKLDKMQADTTWQLVRTYQMPQVPNDELERAIKAAEDFLKQHPAHPYAVEAAWLIAQTYEQHQRFDDAVAAYEAFIKGENHKLPEGDAANTKSYRRGNSPSEFREQNVKLALFRIGYVRYHQHQYDAAIEHWQQYIAQFPNGPQWAESQRWIINARFMQAVDAVAKENYDEARQRFDEFLTRHPLDDRARQILFTFGQITYAQTQKAEEELEKQDGNREKINLGYRKAIEEWQRLVSKYPNTEEASLALYRIGMIYEEKLGELDKALETYRRLNFGSYAARAAARVTVMTKKHLELTTPRKFRTNETAHVKLNLRNIEKLTVKQYNLDLEAYFRKTHGTGNIENLDIDLIEPDKTWEVKIDDYAKYKPLEQTIDVAFGKKNGNADEAGNDNPPGAGVCIINVSEEDYQSSTLVVRSDLDLIIKSSKRQVLAFVQDMVTGKPAAGVELLISDGKQVFHTGETGEDGVYLAQLKELEDCESVRVFAKRGGNVASNMLSVANLSVSTGLTKRGYLYTDRSAYEPGQTVSLRGIVRDVVNGSYIVPKQSDWRVTVTDPAGRLIWEQPVKLSEFGTFHMQLELPSAAQLGGYSVAAQPKDDNATVHRGSFNVQRIELAKVRLDVEFDRLVYFRGETVRAKIKAEYYWGEPVANRQVRYTLPDGRNGFVTTNRLGEAEFTFDTTGQKVGAAMAFGVHLPSENVSEQGRVWLSATGFAATVAPAEPLALAGAPFSVTVKTQTPDGKPVGKEMTLTVLRRAVVKPDAVLTAVPWLSAPAQPGGEVTVSEQKVTTDEKTGEATVQLSLEKGGQYVLRVAGQDRFDNTVTAQDSIYISDDEDATKLRFFADSRTLKVGQGAKVRLHSRLAGGLALLTFEGETIIGHRVVDLKKGFNPVDFQVEHGHYPNFNLAVAVMDDRALRGAAKAFRVEREFKVTITPKRKVIEPGEENEIAISVTDQLDKPVQAELSLAMVDEALFAAYPDGATPILSFFQDGAWRHAGFATEATNDFAYSGQTKAIVKEIQEEGERLVRAQQELQELQQAQMQLGAVVQSFESNNAPRGVIQYRIDPNGEMPNRQAELAIRGAAPGSYDGDGAFNGAVPSPDAPAKDPFGGRHARPDGSNTEFAIRELTKTKAESGKLGDVAAVLRRELPDAGYWKPDIVTDENGKATVTVTMPENTTRWRLTARGVTVETLVGQNTAEVVTRKNFFVDLKAPEALRQGDKPRVLARLHNLAEADYAGPVTLTLLVRDGDKTLVRQTKTIEVEKATGAEVLFDPFETPATADLSLQVSAEAGELRDVLARDVDVQPWGLELADHGGGVATGNAAVSVELPRGRKYDSRWLTVTVGPSLKQAVIDMALQPGGAVRPLQLAGGRHILPPRHDATGYPGGELLAVVGGLEYASAINAQPTDHQRLKDRARALVASIVASQHDSGAWGWAGSKNDDWTVTAATYWALVRANVLATPVNEQTMQKAEAFLKNHMTKIASTDNEARAVLVHALSTNKRVDFTHVNALYRERNNLSATALAYTALAFVNLDRKELAAEVVAVLESRAKETKADGATLVHWSGEGRYHWLNDEVESTALALLALSRVKPASTRAKQAADYLMQRRGCFGFTPAKSRGPAVLALTEYYRQAKFAAADYKLTVLVGDKEVATIEGKDDAPSRIIPVPGDLLADGATMVNFRMEGNGEYAYSATLRGFTADLKDPESFGYPHVRKRYYRHAPLEYRGQPIGAASTSPVHNLEIGQRTMVWVDLYEYSYGGYLVMEEHFPAGTRLVKDSLRGNFHHVEYHDNRIVMYMPAGVGAGDIHYELVGQASGDYRALPTVLRDALDPGKMRLGETSDLTVLPPGVKSPDPYVMNDGERLALARAYFDDGLYDEALKYLPTLFDRQSRYAEADVARMLLWIHTTDSFYDARRVVETFEVLRRRYPELTIPFDKILIVGKAYRDIEEFERAMLVFRATIDNSFINDSNVSAVLQDEGELLASIDYQENLWRRYPDTAESVGSLFALAQLLYEKAPQAHTLGSRQGAVVPTVPGHAAVEGVNGGAINGGAINGGLNGANATGGKPTKVDLYRASIDMLTTFMTLYPEHPLTDDAAFSLSNVLLDMKSYDAVVSLSDTFKQRYDESEFVSSFQYMTALGYFWQREYDPALKAAEVVAEGESKDCDFARYILGQIYHAEGKPALAIKWYETVDTKYADAKQAISYFEEQRIKLDEVNIFRPGKPVELELSYRNIREADLQVYKVDLMKLYLREKNLSNITEVNLAGIAPQQVLTKQLGDGKDYVDKEATLKLDLKDEGAYLVICRGDDLFTSGLVLITPLEIEVQEDATSGTVRANVIDKVKNLRPAEVHVKAIGSADSEFRSGETDLRGLFVATNLRGKATVIARDDQNRYAFYRGDTWLGAPMNQPSQRNAQQQAQPGQPLDYQGNLREQQFEIQRGNYNQFDQLRRGQNKGVQVKDAY